MTDQPEAASRRIQGGEHVTLEPVAIAEVSRRMLELAQRVARSECTVLIVGASGTGKEVLARYIHRQSARAANPFIAVNCAALPESMLEAILFGYERGAFTGAHAAHAGKFEQAQGGTLLLDEVTEMPLALQAKLLRVLQEREVERLGGRGALALDVRVVATTNRRLREEVAAGRFREDLYYRLYVIAITAPPLRARREDVPLLVDHFLGLYCAKNGRQRLKPTRGALDRMLDYPWPGNVRELENVIERAVVLSRSDSLTEQDLPEAVAQAAAPPPTKLAFDIGTPLDEIELRVIRETLRSTKGDKSLAAQLLGISTRTIYRKLDGVTEDEGSLDPALTGPARHD
jgi:two-component system response regulator HydG